MTLFRRSRPAGQHAADAATERIPAQPAPACLACSPMDYGPCTCLKDCGHLGCTGSWRDVPPEKQHGIATPETLAALVARAQPQDGAAGAPPTLPHALPSAWRNGVQAWSEVIPVVPLTMEAPIYDALGGDEEIARARTCDRCGVPGGRHDYSWRYDALGYWCCPSCQAGPEWRSPSLPALREPATETLGWEESRLIYWAKRAVNPRPVRQRPDGLWMAAIPIGGRIRAIGPFRYQTDAEEVYASFLDAASDAAERGAA